ncbi:hypothetical protein LTR42_005373 [Elasticomyces elasticus]|nr:hypothetical protein LTR42_005373 [Elasticomyces elasticus]
MSTQPDDSLNRDRIYQNSPLTGQHIRLLTIRPGATDDRLEFDLTLVDWRHPPTYEALSYAWGSSAERHKIRLDDRVVFVTSNLKNALFAFRYPDRPRVLWVDALCINQNSIAEKNHQIRLMDQIYSRAERVKVWLGEEREPDDAKTEPVFLRDLDGIKSNPVFTAMKLNEEDGHHSAPWEDGIRGLTISLPRPFSFSLDAAVTADVNTLLSLLPRHGQCVYNSTWVRDGAKDDNTGIAFCFLQAMARDEHATGMSLLLDFCYRCNVLRVISVMIRRAWWTRTWTIQEIALAQNTDIVLERVTVPWSMLVAAASNIVKHRLTCCARTFSEMSGHEVNVLLEFCRKVMDVEGIRRMCRNERPLLDPAMAAHPNPVTMPIEQTLKLLWYTRPREASDARDKIYGLLGVLKTWSGNPLVVPNYSLPAQDVFRDLTTALINRTKGYDILMGNLGKSGYPELPSWVAELDSKPSVMPGDGYEGKDQYPNEHPELVQLKGLPAYSPPYSDRLPSWVPDFAAPASTFEKERIEHASLYCASRANLASTTRVLDGSVLEVNTLPVDTIKSVGPVMVVARETSLNPVLKQWTILVVEDAAERGYDLQNVWRRDYLNGGNIKGAFQQTLCMDSMPTTAAEAGQSTIYRRMNDTDLRTYDRWAASIMVADNYRDVFLSFGKRDQTSLPVVDSEMALFGVAVKAATFLRCFFITERGYFGLGPSQARPGDDVKVFLGGRVPFVVRSVDPSNAPSGSSAPPGGYFSLVGDCFVQGIMDGESCVNVDRTDLRSCYLV